MQQIRCEIGLDQQKATSTDRAGRRAVRGHADQEDEPTFPGAANSWKNSIQETAPPKSSCLPTSIANCGSRRPISAPRTKEPYASADRAGPRSLLKLVGQTCVDWQGRAHFLAVAAPGHAADTRGSCSRQARQSGTAIGIASHWTTIWLSPSRDVDLLALEDALAKLAKLEPRQANDRTAILRRTGRCPSRQGYGHGQTIGGAGMDHRSRVVAEMGRGDAA